MKHKNTLSSPPISRIVIGIVGCIGVLSLLIWIANSSNSKETPQGQTTVSQTGGQLEADETSFKFGTVSMAQGTVKKIIPLRNDGSGPVTITRIQTSCMCTSARLIKGSRTFGPFGMAGHGFLPSINEEIAAGEEAQLEIVFDPAAHGPAGVGSIERVVTIEHSAQPTPMNIEFSAVVTP
ncbi:MAG: DUF1573 domain-containing protein [Patescibacteria group bacterium]